MQPLQLLSDTYKNVTAPIQTFMQTTTDSSVSYLKPLNIVKITQVLSNVDVNEVVESTISHASTNNVTSVYGMCNYLYNIIKNVIAA